MIWDDHQNKCIGELKFRTKVHAVRLRRDRVVVVLESKVFVCRFKDLKLLDQITTAVLLDITRGPPHAVPAPLDSIRRRRCPCCHPASPALRRMACSCTIASTLPLCLDSGWATWPADRWSTTPLCRMASWSPTTSCSSLLLMVNTCR